MSILNCKLKTRNEVCYVIYVTEIHSILNMLIFINIFLLE